MSSMIQRYLKTTFFLFVLFSVTNCFAQYRIYPFEDYSKCQVGFIRQKSDTLFNARFENLQPQFLPLDGKGRLEFDYYRRGLNSNSNNNAWILSENGRFGCLSTNGNWIVSCKYDVLQYDMQNNYFSVQLGGKYGVVAVGDTVLVPAEFDKISPEYSSGYLPVAFLVMKNNLTGLYSRNGKEIIPPVYQSINRIQYYNWSTKAHKLFYVVQKDNLKGIIAEDGLVVIEPLYKNIEFLQEELDPEWETLFRIENTAGDFSVFNGSGKQLLPFKPVKLFPVNTLASVREKRSVSFVERIDSLRRHQLISLTTGKESDWYDNESFIGDEIFVYSMADRGDGYGWEIDNWQLLDSNYNLIYSNESVQDKLHYFEYNSDLEEAEDYHGQQETEGLYAYLIEMERLFNIKTSSSVYVIDKTIEPTKKQLRKDINASSRHYFSLLNGKTGIRTPFIYKEVLRVGGPNQICYWGIRLDDENETEDEVTVDVYDSLSVFLRTICIDRMEIYSIQYYCREGIDGTGQRWSGAVIPVKNLGNLMGAVRLDGTRVVPSVFEGTLTVFYSTSDTSGIFLNALRKGKSRFYNFQGEPLLDSIGYDWIHDHDGFTGLVLNNQYTLVLPDLTVELDSCSKPYRMSYKTDFRFNAPQAFWTTERQGYLYGFWDNHFHLLNSETFVKPEVTVQLSDTTFLDFNGKIQPVVLSNKPVTERFGQIYLTLSGSELKVETEKHKIIQIIKNVYKYERFKTKIKISLLSNQEGLLEPQTGLWMLKPMYQQVDLVYLYRSDCFWAKDNTVDLNKWFVVSADGKRITEPLFDSIFQMTAESGYAGFVSKDKFGFVNNKFEIVSPAIFDDVIRGYFHNIYASGDKYYLLDQSTGKTFQITQNFVVSSSTKYGHLFLFNDSIRILGLDGTEQVAPMKLADAMATLNLRKYLLEPELKGQPFPYVLGSQLYCSDTDTVLRRVSNNMLIEKVKGSAFPMKDLFRSDRLVSKEPSCLITALWANPYVYSEKVSGKCYTHPMIGSKEQSYSFRNYAIDSTGLRPLRYADLFVEGSDYEKRLDEAIADAIQKQQIYGTSCADLPKAVSEFKRNFYINKDAIVFVNYGIQREIELDVVTLKDLLKNREYFQ